MSTLEERLEMAITALTSIAAIPLWSDESDALDPEFVAIARESGEWDDESGTYQPSCDTESTQLRDAVEIARDTVASLSSDRKAGVSCQ